MKLWLILYFLKLKIALGGCSLAGLADCLCPNTTLRAYLSQCVQESCSYEDQVASLEASQDLCHGYPIPDRQDEIRITGMVLPIVSALVVALRYVSRITVAKRLWWDDWTALMATMSNIATGVICIFYSQMGFGRHFWDIDARNGKTILQLLYVTQMLYIITLFCAKVSLSAFYCRVFVNKRLLYINYVFILLYVVKFVLFTFLVMFQCLPVQAIWDRSIDGRCLNTSIISYTGSAITIVEDIVLIIIPIPELLKLQLKPRKKLALIFMFCLGLFATITSIIRLQYLVLFSHTYDPTWDNSSVVVWSSIEVNVAILCGSFPALLPLLKKIGNHLNGSTTTPQSYKRYHISRNSPALRNNNVKDQTHGSGVALRQDPRLRNQVEVIQLQNDTKPNYIISSRSDSEA
ncbi:hypothetical protein LX32DRAFT_702450 [Colletotrichum zoysiae]|uniref:Integral membrane protein n=1 Tax=Colletotrichum zoysiae TaxID=1216348 RepID=A0AAD9M9C8_9PEZI|nr:hypothetical protein LX32DRAFT_702450 [Colletotrichum zoysiae]